MFLITTSNGIGQIKYDSAGNQTRALAEDGTWLRFEYDAANRLQIVKKDDGTLLQAFQYGSSNARLMDLDYGYGYLKIFASNGGATLAEYTEFAGAIPTRTKSYTYLGDSQLSTITPNGAGGETTEYNHPDQLGTRTVTNQAAGTSYEQTTLPFGTALNAESSGSQSKRFTSYERSARTGLDYAVNRTYDSKQGRFTQTDPIEMSAVNLGSPQTLNLYTYCGNDPINYTDANGLFFGSLFKWIGKTFKVFNKILKWIVVAVVVLLVIAAIVYTAGGAMPAFLGGGNGLLGIIGSILGKIGVGVSSFIAAAIGVEIGANVGFGIAAGLYGVGAIANEYQGKSKQTKKFPCPPTAQKIIGIFSNTFKNLLKNQSGHRTNKPLENGGWIYQREDGSLDFKMVNPSQRNRDYTDGLNNPPTIKGARAIATVHTHPYKTKQMEDYLGAKNKGLPTWTTGTHGGDNLNSGMPNIVISEDYDYSSKQHEKGEIGSKIVIDWVGVNKVEQRGCK